MISGILLFFFSNNSTFNCSLRTTHLNYGHVICRLDLLFHKTSNIWGVDNMASGTNTNRIVIFSKNQ